MLSLTRETQMDKAKRTLRDVASYADEVVRDERLRADLRAAAGHGTKASARIRKDLDASDPTTRLVEDKKLRRNLRALLDDLDSAGDRVVRRKKSHRVRNVLLIVAGIAAALAAVRFWFSEPSDEPETIGTSQPLPTV